MALPVNGRAVYCSCLGEQMIKANNNLDGLEITLIELACQDRWYVDQRDGSVLYKQVKKKQQLIKDSDSHKDL